MTGDEGRDRFECALECDVFDAATWAPLPVRAAAATARAVPALLAWAARAGAWFEPIEIAVAADGNRTVQARRAVAAGEPLIIVPRRLMITEDDVGEHELVSPMRYIEGTMLSPPCAIGVWLALEQANPDSRWRPYLDALPAAYPWMALHRPAAELAALTGTRALAMIAYQARGCRVDLEELGRRIPELAALPLAEHTWGRLVAGSRCFRIRAAGGSTRALVPVADMFDHGAIDATWGYVDGEQRFEVRAAHDLVAGQEIQISYGRNTNATLVSRYGFAVTDNPEDEVVIDLPTAAGGHGLTVASRYDQRFRLAMATAQTRPDGADREALLRIAAAARSTKAAIAQAPPPAAGDPAWPALCERVRASERTIASAIVEFVERITGPGAARPRSAWLEVIDGIDPAATGAARLVREFAQAAIDQAE